MPESATVYDQWNSQVLETVFSANVALCRSSSIFVGSEITNDLSKFKAAFFKRFTEDDHILDLSILQTTHGPNESVRDYLSRLFHTATNKSLWILRPIPLKFIKF
jgi:hypothetical protein